MKNSAFYSDDASHFVLTSYDMITASKQLLSNVTVVANNGVVYLSTLNVAKGVIPFGEVSWNSSELPFVFDDLNLVYTNSGCEVYRNKP